MPLGPVHLVWQDAVMLSVAVGLCWPRAGMESLHVLQAFGFCYLFLLGVALFHTGQKAWGYAIAFGLGAMALSALNPFFYIVTAVIYLIAFLGLRASLALFPWDGVPEFRQFQRMLKSSGRQAHIGLGWPFERLGPRLSYDAELMPTERLGASLRSYTDLKPADALLTSLLMGWGLFIIVYYPSSQERPSNSASMILIITVLSVAGGRIVRYCHGFAPPLSLRGRLAHGRLIIPGYDKVFAAPLLAITVTVISLLLPAWIGMPKLIAVPLGAAVSLWILLGMGPRFSVWRLTGNHRIAKGVMGVGQQIK